MKLAENNIENDVKEIIADYEINIHKAIDEMMLDTENLGCFSVKFVKSILLVDVDNVDTGWWFVDSILLVENVDNLGSGW